MSKPIIPIPWKNLPVPVDSIRYGGYVLYADYGAIHWNWLGNIPPSPCPAAIAWCTDQEWRNAMESMRPEPPLPEIIKPKWSNLVQLYRMTNGWRIECHLGSDLNINRAYPNEHIIYGPARLTEREAIEAWNALMS